MEKLTVDLEVLVPVILSVVAPTIVGFLQQYSKKFAEKAPLLKGIVSLAVGSLIGTITAYASQGDILLSSTAGAVIGGFGAVNIFFRKGTRTNLEVELQKEMVAKSIVPCKE